MIGLDAAALIGQSIEDLVVKEDRNLIGDLLQIAARHGRIENGAIRLQGLRGVTPPLAFAGYQLEDLDGHYFLALRTGVPTRREEAPGARFATARPDCMTRTALPTWWPVNSLVRLPAKKNGK